MRKEKCVKLGWNMWLVQHVNVDSDDVDWDD